jgi:SAM-dependent methyltransferase
MSQPAPEPTEKTFTAYTPSQGALYAAARRDYHPSVYAAVLGQHASDPAAPHALLVDVGCGPGRATAALAPHFDRALGLDPSAGMIATARSLAATYPRSRSGAPIRFAVSTAEALGADLSGGAEGDGGGPAVAPGTASLVVAANAAHWFGVPAFWRAAARQLAPGGSVALWTSGNVRVHPACPGAARVQAAMDAHTERYLAPHTNEGTAIARSGYDLLPRPWDADPPVPEFEREGYFRKQWALGEPFVVGEDEVDLDTFEKMMATGSAVTRWRQAHPELVGTEEDVLRVLRREIEAILHDEGVEPGKEKVKGTAQGVLLMFRKKA